MGHRPETDRALRTLVDPTAFFAAVDLASARGSVSRLGTTSTGLHYTKTCIKFQRARRARWTSASRDLMASRYFSRMLSSTCLRKTTIGSSSCSMRHVGHSMLVSNQVVMHLLWKMCLHLSFLSVRFVSSRQTAHVCERWARHFPSSTAALLHLAPDRVTDEQFISY